MIRLNTFSPSLRKAQSNPQDKAQSQKSAAKNMTFGYGAADGVRDSLDYSARAREEEEAGNYKKAAEYRQKAAEADAFWRWAE